MHATLQRRCLALALVMAASACGGARGGPSSTAAAPCLIDLSYTYDDDTVYWPTAPSKFQKETLSYGLTHSGYFYSAFTIATPEHGGTHIDAPIHFAGWPGTHGDKHRQTNGRETPHELQFPGLH